MISNTLIKRCDLVGKESDLRLQIQTTFEADFDTVYLLSDKQATFFFLGKGQAHESNICIQRVVVCTKYSEYSFEDEMSFLAFWILFCFSLTT